jgi:hypothetical protein
MGAGFSGGDATPSPSSASRAILQSEALRQEFAALRPEIDAAVCGTAHGSAKACVEAKRLASVYEKVHGLPENQALTALCLSGGGIRSASFALGVLQGLAKHRVLERFDYLSTVSGGGYIGSWLTAWIHRHGHGLDGVCQELRSGRPAGHGKSCGVEPEPVALPAEPVAELDGDSPAAGGAAPAAARRRGTAAALQQTAARDAARLGHALRRHPSHVVLCGDGGLLVAKLGAA